MKTEIHSQLESQISEAIRYDNNCTVSFDYSTLLRRVLRKIMGFDITVQAFTTNPKTGETFLLKRVSANNIEEGLKKILNYVDEHKKNYSSFTVEWTNKITSGHKIEISYFYCRDAKEALDKFYFNKERSEYIVYLVKMNPIS